MIRSSVCVKPTSCARTKSRLGSRSNKPRTNGPRRFSSLSSRSMFLLLRSPTCKQTFTHADHLWLRRLNRFSNRLRLGVILAQPFFDFGSMPQIKCDRAIYVGELQRVKRLHDLLRRLAALEFIHNYFKQNSTVSNPNRSAFVDAQWVWIVNNV